MAAPDHTEAGAATDIDLQVKKDSAIATKGDTFLAKSVCADMAAIDKAPQSDFSVPKNIRTKICGSVYQISRDA
ncbi:hypothetical protein [Novosphingobium sp. MMS21-SN21R]|uniref:hypothetical protein n=1 Tax=Novosphingobium sp. MMS21-SN21R TaxID=2969298 RepID=UPI002884F991|nr:hypothetical protein [Novosphingobium sp. MMS21-SN21R]MDT0507162.1 hypothetical protein [Novosphingobium sp. MMS21-SN21R]